MAVAYDNAATAEVASATSLTFSLTTAGSDRGLLVGVSIFNGAGNPNITGITYAGTAMVFIGRLANPDTSQLEYWRLENPTVGANNVVVTLPSAAEIVAAAVSVTGADQTDLRTDTDIVAVNNGTTHTVTMTSASGELVVDFLNCYFETMTVDASQIARIQNDNGVNLQSIFASTEAGAASVPMTWTSSDAAHTVHAAVSVKASGAAPAVSLPPPASPMRALIGR